MSPPARGLPVKGSLRRHRGAGSERVAARSAGTMDAPLNGRPGAPRPRVLPWGGRAAVPAEGAGPPRPPAVSPPPARPRPSPPRGPASRAWSPTPPPPPRPGIPPPARSNCSFEAPADVAAPRALPPCARGCRPAARFQLLFILSFSTLLKPARGPGLQLCSAGLLAGGAGRGRGRGGGAGPWRGAGPKLWEDAPPIPAPPIPRVGARPRASQDSLSRSSVRAQCSDPPGCFVLSVY